MKNTMMEKLKSSKGESIAEVLVASLVMSSTELRKLVNESGDFVPMIANARDLVQQGVTTLDEVVREVATIE
jgi:hypothetical protein